jgi:hypothetical protein
MFLEPAQPLAKCKMITPSNVMRASHRCGPPSGFTHSRAYIRQAPLSSVQQMQDCFYISYEMPPRILKFLQKKSGITKYPEKQGFLEEQTLGFERGNKRLARRNIGLAGQTRHLERGTLHPACQTGHRARPIKGSARQTARLPRKLLFQRVQFAFHELRVWMVRAKFL